MGAVPTWHCDPGVARGGHGDLATPCTPCGPWDGVIDSSASGGVKDTGRTRLGEAGRAACVRGGEGDQGAGRARRSRLAANERARRALAPEPVAKAGCGR